jgi:hypothetical protein
VDTKVLLRYSRDGETDRQISQVSDRKLRYDSRRWNVKGLIGIGACRSPEVESVDGGYSGSVRPTVSGKETPMTRKNLMLGKS